MSVNLLSPHIASVDGWENWSTFPLPGTRFYGFPQA